MLLNVYGKNGSVTGQVELPDEVFNVEPSEHAMYLAVKAYLANQRQGTHKTKVRSEVSGGGRKPWKQKAAGQPVLVLIDRLYGLVVEQYMGHVLTYISNTYLLK